MESNTQLGRKIPGHRFATGCFGEVGYITKRPGHGIETEKVLESHAKIRNNIIQKDNVEKAKKKDAFINDYWRKFDMILVRASVDRAVQMGMHQAKRDLVKKQNKLKSVLLGEQSELIIEYTRKAQEALDKRVEATKLHAEDIVKRSDDSERRRAQEVYTKMAMENSDAYKWKMSMEMSKCAQEVNKEIIRLKELQKLSEEDDDVYWNAEAEKRRLKERKLIEMEEAFKRDDETTQRQTLRRHMDDRKRIQKNEACIEVLEKQKRKVIQDEEYRGLDLRAEEARRREALGFQALVQQIGQNKALAKRNRQEAWLVDKIVQDDVRKKLEREQAAIHDQRTQNWRELVIFRQSMVEYRNATQARNQEAERMMEECSKAIELNKYKVPKAKENMRKDLRMESFETAKRMPAENIIKKAALKQKDSEADELAAHYNNVKSRLSDVFMKNKLLEQNPAPYNDESVKYMKVLQERQLLEDREMLENMRRTNDERQRAVMRTLERPLQDICQHQHPVYRFLKSQSLNSNK